MKKNLKLNLSWLAIIVVLFGIIELLTKTNILNLYYIQILMGIGISILMGLGTNLVLGFSGQFTLGQAGFMAIGAYATAIITQQNPTYGCFYFSMLVGIVIAVLVALVFGIPTLRLKGDYLAIATLGMAEIIRIVILPYTSWPVIFIFVAGITVLILNFLRSSTGRQVIAVREDEIAAESMGVNVTKMKVIIFVMGAIISAIAGSLYVGYIGTVVPKDFTIMKSIDYLIIAVLGGLGSITGTILAAIVLGILNMFLQNVSNLRMIIYSLALILVMIFRPGGLLGTKEFTLSRFFNKGKGGNH